MVAEPRGSRWWAAAAACLVLTACGEDGAHTATAAPAPTQTLGYVAADYSYGGPLTAAAGLTRITLSNSGAEEHEMMVLRVPGDVTDLDPATQLLHASFGQESAGEFVGGMHGLLPGKSASMVVDLEPGRYVIGCLIPSPSDLTSHADKGMVGVLTVT